MSRIPLIAILALWPSMAVVGEAPPPAATVLDGDLVWLRDNEGDTAISPDGQHIAYISKGAVWISATTHGPPIKLVDIPDTPTALMAMPQYHFARNDFLLVRRELGNGVYNATIQPMLRHTIGLDWNSSQDGVVFMVRQGPGKSLGIARYDVHHASLDGMDTILTCIERDIDEEPRNLTLMHVAADRRFVVVNRLTPVIWDITRNRPKATPYDYLIPSLTSDRFLGVEIDTKEIVVVDSDFTASKRTGVCVNAEYEFDLAWSADEKFAIYRIATREPWSQSWNGGRVDLDSGEVRHLHGIYWDSRSYFTGRGGEFLQWEVEDAAHRMTGPQRRPVLNLVPDGNGPIRKVLECERDMDIASALVLTTRPLHPAWDREWHFQRFAIALPRGATSKQGYHMHFVDLEGQMQPFKQWDEAAVISPYYVVGFVDSGRHLIGRNDSQLLSIPIAEALEDVLDDENQGDANNSEQATDE